MKIITVTEVHGEVQHCLKDSMGDFTDLFKKLETLNIVFIRERTLGNNCFRNLEMEEISTDDENAIYQIGSLNKECVKKVRIKSTW